MVILNDITTYGPHQWYCSRMWSIDGFFIDYFRISKVNRPLAPNTKSDRNTYNYDIVESYNPEIIRN